jgi:endoribonuclease Dicer
MCHVVEAGNDIDSKALSQTCQVMGKPMLRAWCRTLQSPDGLSYPPAALGSRSRFPQVLYHDNEVIEDPVTGGIIGCSDAVGVILAFASNFADKPPTRPLLSYNHTPQGVYMCTVHLTDVISDDVVASSGHSQAHARRVACFKACQILQTQGALDSTYFRPILDTVSESSVPAVTNNKYHRKAPRFWDRCIASPANRLHPTLVHLEATSGATATIPTGAKGVDIFILTTQRLPSLFPFNVYRTGSTTSSLDISRVSSTQGAPFSVSDSQLKQLHHYTLKVTRLITNRRFVCSLDQMSYFIAPCKPFRRAEVGRAHSTIHEDIDWQQVLQSLETWISALTLEDVNHESRILDYVVQERAVEFTQHFFVKTVRRDLTPLSKPVEHSVSSLRHISCA